MGKNKTSIEAMSEIRLDAQSRNLDFDYRLKEARRFSRKVQNGENTHFVYFISSYWFNFVKIGITRQTNLVYRLQALQVGNPFPLDYIGLVITRRPRKTERNLHFTYREYQATGEWFDIKDQYVNEIKSRYQDEYFDVGVASIEYALIPGKTI